MVKHLFGQTIQNINEIEIGARGQYLLTHSDLRSAVTKKSLFFLLTYFTTWFFDSLDEVVW